jgi:peptidoglycan/xylan/chitin deacetylase (PgdA/CDA1 family)
MPSMSLFRPFLLMCCLAFALWPVEMGAGANAGWFTEGDVSCGRVALVFTLGMGGAPSGTIPRTLTEKDVDATMFPTGPFARSQPEYLRRLDGAGFEIGTHGETALALTTASDESIRIDIRASVTSIGAVIGRPIDPYHTPYAGNTDERVRAVVASEGLLAVGWTISAMDEGPDATEEAVFRAVVDSVYPGAIVEMHLDAPATEGSTALALPRIIDELRSRGYEFVTIGEMLEPCPGTPVAMAQTVTLTGLDVHGLHCKVAPTAGARTIRILLDGETVPVRGPAFDGWLPVECAGHDGWIKADAVT